MRSPTQVFADTSTHFAYPRKITRQS